jgi:hypothetical protein
MDDYFGPQHSTSVGLPPLYIASHKGKMASQLMDTMVSLNLILSCRIKLTPLPQNESGLYPSLDMHPGFSDMSIPHSDGGIIMPTLTSIEPDLYHITSAPHSAMPSSAPPTESDYDSATGGQGPHKNVRFSPQHQLHTTSPKLI